MMGAIGRITLAVTMILLGLGLLAHNLNLLDGLSLIRWWPVLLILLGAEIVVRSRLNGQGQRLDGFSLVIVLLLTGTLAFTSWVAAWLPPELEGFLRGPWPRSFNARYSHKEVLTVEEPVTAAARLRVETALSSVRITAAPDDGEDKVTAQAVITAWGYNEAEARRLAQEVRMALEEQGDEMVLTVQEAGTGGTPGQSFGVELEIAVPRQLGATVVTKLGEVAVAGLTGPVSVEAEVGDVELRDLSGPVDVTATIGDIHIHLAGDAHADVELSSRLGDVAVNGAAAVVERRGPSVFTSFRLGDGGVPVKAQADVGSIRLTVGGRQRPEMTVTAPGAATEPGRPAAGRPVSGRGL